MADTTNLMLPLMAAAQAQKHVTHNEAILRLDALVQMSVFDRDRTAPPAEPHDGDRYIPASGATGAWAEWDWNIARYSDGVWSKLVPRDGWIVHVEDEQRLLVHSAGEWVPFAFPRFAAPQLIFTPGGDGEVSIYRVDGALGQNPRNATIAGVSGDLITLTTNTAASLFDGARMDGVSYARIWNVSKAPEQPAWVAAQPASDQLQVLEPADISGWSSADTIQLGDPDGITPGRVIALDISPMMQTALGSVFRQGGIIVKPGITGATAGDNIALSPNGAGGSFVPAARSAVAGQFGGEGVTIIPCTEASPVSNSNLVFLRETIATTASIRLLSVMAVFG